MRRAAVALAASTTAALLGGGAVTYALMQPPRVPGPLRVRHEYRPDTAVVLGIGGLTGAIWETCMVARLIERGQLPPAPDLVVGTSAGSLTAALLRSDLTPNQMRELSVTGELTTADGVVRLPNPLADRVCSSEQVSRKDSVAHTVTDHRPPHLTAMLAGMLPPTGFSLLDLARAVDGLSDRPGAWPEKPTWIPATDLATGHRAVFGMPGEPITSLGSAVAASCAVPGLLSPVRVGPHYYVDGGVVSFTHVDLAALARPRRLLILNPLARLKILGGQGAKGRFGVLLKRVLERDLARGIAVARQNGTHVVLLEPNELEHEAMGPRLMDFDRGELIAAAVAKR